MDPSDAFADVYDALGDLLTGAERWATYLYDLGLVQRLSSQARQVTQQCASAVARLVPTSGPRRALIEDDWEFIEH